MIVQTSDSVSLCLNHHPRLRQRSSIKNLLIGHSPYLAISSLSSRLTLSADIPKQQHEQEDGPLCQMTCI